jgi:hypothetical protein
VHTPLVARLSRNPFALGSAGVNRLGWFRRWEGLRAGFRPLRR